MRTGPRAHRPRCAQARGGGPRGAPGRPGSTDRAEGPGGRPVGPAARTGRRAPGGARSALQPGQGGGPRGAHRPSLRTDRIRNITVQASRRGWPAPSCCAPGVRATLTGRSTGARRRCKRVGADAVQRDLARPWRAASGRGPGGQRAGEALAGSERTRPWRAASGSGRAAGGQRSVSGGAAPPGRRLLGGSVGAARDRAQSTGPVEGPTYPGRRPSVSRSAPPRAAAVGDPGA